MNGKFLTIVFASVVAVVVLLSGLQPTHAKDKRHEPAAPQAWTYTGPKLRAVVSELEVKVQSVATTVSTPTGGTSVVFLDLQQPTDFGSGLTEMLTTALVQSQRYVVLDRKAIAELAAARSAGGIPAVGSLLDAQILVKGAVTELSFKRSGGGTNLVTEVIDGSATRSVATVAIDLRIVDVATGQILDSVRAVGKVGSNLLSLTLKSNEIKLGLASFDNGPLGLAVRSAVDTAVAMIGERTARIPWEARVAEVLEENEAISLYLNAGENTGLKAGDILDVSRAGKPITDPATGVVIGRTRGKVVGKCRIASVEPSLSVAAPVEGTGFQRDDVVRFPNH